MSFGKTIKDLRRKQDLTQERLAEILSISPQAISRWETDMAMPDISLIAPLCHLFNVTSDELLGIDLAGKKEAVKAICEEADKYARKGYLDKAREILEDGLQKYPDNCQIINELMYVSSWQKDATGDCKYLHEAIQWGEKLLAQSTDDQERHSAIQVLCFCYRDAGRLDEAVKMAQSMPFMSVSREMLLSRIYAGDQAYRAKQSEAYDLLQFLSTRLDSMQTKLDSGEWAYTADECAALRDKRIALLHLLFENGDFGFYHAHLYETHRDQAFYYAKKGEADKALEHLALAAEHSIKFITSVNEEQTSLLLRGMDHGTWASTDPDNDANHLLLRMDDAVFDNVRESEAFGKIKERLSEYAGKWCAE